MENESRTRWAELLDSLATKEGQSISRLKQVRFIRVSDRYPRGPSVYEPSIVIVGQGRKIGYLGEKVYVYDQNNYLVLSVPLPFECETIAVLMPDSPRFGSSSCSVPEAGAAHHPDQPRR